MTIDPTTDVGKIRLRVGDVLDLALFPDAVYQTAIADCQGNLPRAAALMAQYILGTLTARTHKKLGQLEVYGAEYFDNYVKFIKLTVLNPNLMQIAPIPYGSGSDEKAHPLVQFMNDWNANYANGTQSQQLKNDAYSINSTLPNGISL